MSDECTPKATKKGKERVMGESNGSVFLKHLAGDFETHKEADLRRDDFQQGVGHFGYIRVIRQDLMHSNSLKLVFLNLAAFYPTHHPECYLLFRTSCLFSSV